MTGDVIRLERALSGRAPNARTVRGGGMMVWVSDPDHSVVAGLDQFSRALAAGLPMSSSGRQFRSADTPAGRLVQKLMQPGYSGSVLVETAKGPAMRVIVTPADRLTVWMARTVSFCLQSVLADIVTSLHLTSREADVASLLARNLSEADISSELAISEETVRSHRRNIYGKLGVADRGDFMMYVASHCLA